MLFLSACLRHQKSKNCGSRDERETVRGDVFAWGSIGSMIPPARARELAKSGFLCALLLVLTRVSAPASDMTSTLLIGGSKIDVTIESEPPMRRVEVMSLAGAE